MKRILKTLKKKWPEYLIEGTVIITSILVAIELENWNDKRKEKESAANYLLLIEQDLNADIAHFDYLLNIIKNQAAHFDSIENILKLPASNGQTLQKVIKDNSELLAMQYEDANLNTSTYQNLQNSGNMSLLPRELQQSLVKLHLNQTDYKNDILNNAETKRRVIINLTEKIPIKGISFGFETSEDIAVEMWKNIAWEEVNIIFYNTLSINRLVSKYAIKSIEGLKEETKEVLQLIHEIK